MNRMEERDAILDISPQDFKTLGYGLVDRLARFLSEMPEGKVTSGKNPDEIREVLGKEEMPLKGMKADELLTSISEKLIQHSLFNGHPKFWGYITSSASPMGALSDMLAASINPNVGASRLSPVATEIEAQSIQWLAELIGYPNDCGGILVSGGNMANFVAFLAARKAKADWDIRREGIRNQRQLVVYVSKATHTWIEKAADLFGMGTDSIRWIDSNEEDQMNADSLEQSIIKDSQDDGLLPFMVVGAAGTVGIGAIDPLMEISEICTKYNLWFHVDGAYGAPAAALPEAEVQLKALSKADSVALDPHKWLYAPLEAGCTLVRNSSLLRDAFSFVPDYYSFDSSAENPPINYFEYGMQNSRGFRALKVWMGLKQAGRNGYVQMIRDDIELAKMLYDLAESESDLEALTHNLSITTFRYNPASLVDPDENYLNELNKQLMEKLQNDGNVFVSNAIVNQKFALRACIVNFRTTVGDIKYLVEEVLKVGAQVRLEKDAQSK